MTKNSIPRESDWLVLRAMMLIYHPLCPHGPWKNQGPETEVQLGVALCVQLLLLGQCGLCD